MIISRSVVLRMRNVSDSRCGENQNIIFMFSNFFPPENRALYKITWKNIVGPGSPQLRIAVCVSKATHTQNQGRRLRVASGATAPGPALEGAPRFRPMSLSSYILR